MVKKRQSVPLPDEEQEAKLADKQIKDELKLNLNKLTI